MAGYTVNFNINAGKIGADTSVITADSAEFVTASFSFDDSWNGLYKTAVFRFGEKVYHVVLENDTCKFPQEVLLNGMCYVSVFGVLNTTRATTAEVGIEVEKSGFVKVEPAAQTPDPYNYFLQAATAQKQAAEAAAAEALESQNKAQLAATAATEQSSAAYQNAQSATQSANLAEGYKALAQQNAKAAESAKSSAVTAAEQAGASATAAQSSADQAAENAATAQSAKTACLALAPTEIAAAELNVTQLPSSASGYYKAVQNLKLVREAGSTENYYIPKDAVFAVYKSYDSEIGGDYTYYELQLLNSCILGEVGETI